jgi:hypothetical protein
MYTYKINAEEAAAWFSAAWAKLNAVHHGSR